MLAVHIQHMEHAVGSVKTAHGACNVHKAHGACYWQCEYYTWSVLLAVDILHMERAVGSVHTAHEARCWQCTHFT